ncbi:MAG: type II restriction endonuclease [Bacteroides sp.]|nr:type II restriction endonuclease [Bacteroides sp.]MCM1085948.1 type II restriction endonuclease [Bacteroides sp.]
MRDFDQWLAGFRDSIADYKYYIDFDKVYRNVDHIKVELNILNSLIGSENIEDEFERIVIRYPETLKCIPILLAKRETEILVVDSEKGTLNYRFDTLTYSVEQYKVFMRETGLFDLLQKRILNNLVDYVTGIETGLDSNGRKNRGGHLMENLVESYLEAAGLVKDETYFKEMYISEIQKKWKIDLSSVSNDGKAEKRFDFIVKGKDIVYGIETNCYTGGGSKLNETARSYKTIALETKDLKNFKFVWFTDGRGWQSAKNNLRETFDVLEHLYNINDLETGIISKVLI